MGPGDEIPQALEDLGIHPHLLNAQEIASGDLSKYNTIVLGIRAYAARPGTRRQQWPPARLMFAMAETWSCNTRAANTTTTSGLIPTRWDRSPEKVVDETDPVAILSDAEEPAADLAEPDHFRGLRRLGRGARALLYGELGPEVHRSHRNPRPQPGPAKRRPAHRPLRQRNLHLRSLCLYRQTPEAVPGAYRILANLVSAGSHP